MRAFLPGLAVVAMITLMIVELMIAIGNLP